MDSIDDDVAQTFSEDGFNMEILEEFSIDLSLSDVERVEKYIYSDIVMQRLVHVRLIHSLVESNDLEIIREHIIPILNVICNDEEEEICMTACSCLPGIAKAIWNDNHEEGCALCGEYLIPILWNLQECRSGSINIENSVCEAISEIASILPNEVNFDLFLPHIIELFHSNCDTSISFALSVSISICHSLDEEMIISYLLPELSLLCHTGSLTVLKALPSLLSELTTIISSSNFSLLIELINLLLDSSLWVIRKSMLEEFPSLIKSFPSSEQLSLFNTLLSFFQDKSKWVRITAKRVYGYCLSYLPSSQITTEAIQSYTSLVSTPDETETCDIACACAFTFPGVVKAVGSEKWSLLQSCYDSLLQHSSPSIQHTLAASLGEIASLTKGILSSDFLMNSYSSFLNHSDSEIVIATIHSSSLLFQSINTPYQVVLCQQLVDYAKKLTENTFNWRVQEAIMKELPFLVATASEILLKTSLLQLFMLGLLDKASCIRNTTIQALPAFIERVIQLNNQSVLHEIIDTVLKLKEMTYFYRELMIDGIRLYLPLLQEQDDIMKQTREIIKECEVDPVENVRSKVLQLKLDYSSCFS